MVQKRPRRSKRASKQWSSSVLGTHASGGASGNTRQSRSSRRGGAYQNARGTSVSGRRARSFDYSDRTAEINQMRPNATPVETRNTRNLEDRPTHSQQVMRQEHIKLALLIAIAAVVIGVLAFALGSCVFKASLSGNMALNDSELSAALTKAEEGAPEYILLAGINEHDSEGEAASFLGLLRVNPDGGRMTLMDVPANMSVRYNGRDTMLRNLIREGSRAELVKTVSAKLGCDINHYVQITSDGFVKLVDSLGGIEVNVTTRVDDPRVSTIVIDPGTQTLNGQQALALVSAFDYPDERLTRNTYQNEVFLALANKITSEAGFEFMGSVDALSTDIKTDFTYDDLDKLAHLFMEADPFTTAVVPGSQSVTDGIMTFYPSTAKWEQMRELYQAGEDPVVTVDTSGVDKAKVSMIVLNGSGVDGLALQAKELLEADGWTVSDTGNADSYVYDETLVIYRDESDKAAAQAVVDTLGVGRSVYSSVYYNLSTNIQVVVGKDWRVIS